MSDLMKVGADWGGSGVFKPFTSGISGAQRVSDAHGRFLNAVLEGRVFYLSVAAGAPTAYVGAGAGTPLLAVHNPANSNRYLSLLMVGYAARGQVTAAGSTALAAWKGVSVLPTGTITVPRNALSDLNSGSSAIGFSNTALTGSTALNLALPLNAFHLIGATPVSESNMNSVYNVDGLLVAVPGNQIAIGVTTVPTGLTCDLAMFWEELPYMITS
jgi:hypothetical protein